MIELLIAGVMVPVIGAVLLLGLLRLLDHVDDYERAMWRECDRQIAALREEEQVE